MLDSNLHVGNFVSNLQNQSTQLDLFISRREYTEDCIPKSNCLKLIANSEQYLSSIASRRLLTYEKISEPTLEGVESINNVNDDFRTKFFAFDDIERQERRIQRAELREIGKQEAAKRGKIIDDNEKSMLTEIS